jgi:glycerol-3-phosphate O-acyltransferase
MFMNFIRDFFSRILQTILFWWVKVGDNLHNTDIEVLKNTPKLIYVLEYESLSDALVLDKQCRKLGLPSIFKRDSYLAGASVQPLLTVKRGKSLFGPKPDAIIGRIKSILDYLAANPHEDVLLVPAALYWGRAAENNTNPIKAIFSSNWTMVGRFKKVLTVILNGRNTFFEFNDPVSLRQLLGSEIDSNIAPRKVARLLRVHFRRVRAAVIGPDMSHKRLLLDRVLTSDYVRRVIEEQAVEQGVPLKDAQLIARKNAEAIAADVSNNAIRFLSAIMSWVWNRLYQGIRMNGIEQVRELARDNAIVYAPCHRSHIDYLLMSYLLYQNGLNVPHIAAGENINMPIVGVLLRRCGAFYIRRRFGGDKIYTAVFHEYLHAVFTSGFPVEYFVEGGRSRTGRMLKPATGILSMTVTSHLRDNKKPIVIIPVYIGYEKIFEESSYKSELKGKEKKKENLFDLAKTVQKLNNNGEVSVNFGEAIHLNDMLDIHQPAWRESQYELYDKPAWLAEFVAKLSFELAARINGAAALNPVNLVATAMLATPRQAIDGRLLDRHLNMLIDIQKFQPYSDRISFPEGSSKKWIEYTESMESLSHVAQPLGDIYGLNSKNVIAMSYYRNNIQHLYMVPALVAALVAQRDGVSQYELEEIFVRIYPHIRNELFLVADVDQAREAVGSWLNYFADKGLLNQQDDKWFAIDKALSSRLELELLVNIVLPALERYFIGLSTMVRIGSNKCTSEELEKQSQLMAQRLSLLNGLDAPEFFDKTLFRRFIEGLEKQGEITINEKGLIEFDTEMGAMVFEADKILPSEVVYNVSQAADFSLA